MLCVISIRILAWAIIAATVGLILRMIEERSGLLGKIAAALAGGVWSLVTMFVVPVMIFEEKGVFTSMKESLTLFKKTWGEAVVGNISIGVVFAAIAFVGVIFLIGAMFVAGFAGLLIALPFFILLIIILAIVASVMNGIFVVALYIYAKTGSIPTVYSSDLIKNAFIPKKQSGSGLI